MNCKIQLSEKIATECLQDLNMLYAPLVGHSACSLWQLLYAFGRTKTSLAWDDLLFFSGLMESQFSACQQRLETYELLETFESENGQTRIYSLKKPLDFQKMMGHELYGRLLFERLGHEGIERLQRMQKKPELEEFKNVTSVMDRQAFEQRWSQEQEDAFQELIPVSLDLRDYDFDFTRFFQGLGERAFPARLRGRDNLIRIANLARVFAQDEDKMRKLVIRHMKDRKSSIDFDGIVTELRGVSSTKKARTAPDNFKAAPTDFLLANQPEAAVLLPAETRLFNQLEKKGLPCKVINTLTEYVLKQNQGAFSVNYMRTLANNALRLNLKTREQALEWLDNSQARPSRSQSGQSKLPDWYSEIPTEKASQEDVDETLALMDEVLKGLNDDGNR